MKENTVFSTFSDVLPEPIKVNIVEFEEYLVEGKKRRRPVQRQAEIGTYVPMAILHKMLASQERMRRLQSAYQTGSFEDGQQQEMMDWMVSQVTAVWQLTEPDMTETKIMEGLPFQTILSLFQTFFGDLLKTLTQQSSALTVKK